MHSTQHIAMAPAADRGREGVAHDEINLASSAVAVVANLLALALAYLVISSCSDTILALVPGLG